MPIDWKTVVLHRILNLPERPRKTPKAPVIVQPAPAAAEGGNPWRAAVELQPTAPTPVRPPTVAGSSVPEVPWALSDQGASSRAWRRGVRGALLAVVVLFAWIGLRTTVWPDDAPAAAALPAVVTFDKESAAGVATRLTLTALTWDEDDPEAHAQGIGLDYAGGPSDLGWNGKGRQTVQTAVPGTVAVAEDGSAATVTVFARVTTYDRASASADWKSAGTEWITVQVPVAPVDGRMVATGGPSLTGQVTPSKPAPTTRGDEDADLTDSTQTMAEAFFTAYGEGDVSAVEAPGASIPALAGAWRFASLETWSVEKGTGDTRQARASVTWSVEGQAQQVTQTYALTLTKVTGGGADRWQVAQINGA